MRWSPRREGENRERERVRLRGFSPALHFSRALQAVMIGFYPIGLDDEVRTPPAVVRLRIIPAVMDAAALMPPERGARHEAAERQHVLELPSARVVEDPVKHVPRPELNRVGGVAQPLLVAFDPHLEPHDVPERVAD